MNVSAVQICILMLVAFIKHSYLGLGAKSMNTFVTNQAHVAVRPRMCGHSRLTGNEPVDKKSKIQP